MALEDTPAGRLHVLLTEMRRGSNVPLRAAWASIFECDVADTTALIRGVIAVRALPDEIEAAVRRLPNANHDLLLQWRPHVDAAMGIAHQLEGPIENFKGQYTEVDTMVLQLAADQLDRNEPPVHMDPDAVARASELVSHSLTRSKRSTTTRRAGCSSGMRCDCKPRSASSGSAVRQVFGMRFSTRSPRSRPCRTGSLRPTSATALGSSGTSSRSSPTRSRSQARRTNWPPPLRLSSSPSRSRAATTGAAVSEGPVLAGSGYV